MSLVEYSPRAVAIVKAQLAPNATDEELAYFFEIARTSHLRPGTQLVLIPRYDSRLGRNIHRPQVTVEGRRAIALRSGLCEGIEGPMWCGPRTEDNGYQLVWEEVWAPPEGELDFPYCARVFVHRSGWKVPANGTAKWSEFAQEEGKAGERRLAHLWQQMPSHMLGKVAESLALRRAFPEEIEGLAETWGGDDAEAGAVEEAMASATARVVQTEPEPESPPEAPQPPPEPRPAIEATAGPPKAQDVLKGTRQAEKAPAAKKAAATKPPNQRRGGRGDDRPPDDYYDSLPEAQG